MESRGCHRARAAHAALFTLRRLAKKQGDSSCLSTYRDTMTRNDTIQFQLDLHYSDCLQTPLELSQSTQDSSSPARTRQPAIQRLQPSIFGTQGWTTT